MTINDGHILIFNKARKYKKALGRIFHVNPIREYEYREFMFNTYTLTLDGCLKIQIFYNTDYNYILICNNKDGRILDCYDVKNINKLRLKDVASLPILKNENITFISRCYLYRFIQIYARYVTIGNNVVMINPIEAMLRQKLSNYIAGISYFNASIMCYKNNLIIHVLSNGTLLRFGPYSSGDLIFTSYRSTGNREFAFANNFYTPKFTNGLKLINNIDKNLKELINTAFKILSVLKETGCGTNIVNDEALAKDYVQSRLNIIIDRV